MGTYCASLFANSFRNGRVFMLSLSNASVIEVFKSTSRYLDNLLNIDNPEFELIVTQIISF